MKNPKILVVGSLVMDLIVSCHRFPAAGETVMGCGLHTTPGGKGANQAVQAAKLGAEVTMVGKVGNDRYGEELIRSVKEAGVDTSHITRCPTAPTAVGNVQIELKEQGCENRIVVVPGANMELTYADLEFLKTSVSAYDLMILQLEIPMGINLAAARLAFEVGVPVMLNTAPAAVLPKELLQYVTYISPNEQEAAALTGITAGNETSLKMTVRKLTEQGAKHAVITLGKRGAVFANDREFIESPSIEGVTVQDPTGAGDSFIGAFCTAVCLGICYADALVFANAAASLTVSRLGAQSSLPVLSEVLSVIRDKKIPFSGGTVLTEPALSCRYE